MVCPKLKGSPELAAPLRPDLSPPPGSLTPTCTCSLSLPPHPGGSSVSPVPAPEEPARSLVSWSSVGPWALPGASAHLRSRPWSGEPEVGLEVASDGQTEHSRASALPATPALRPRAGAPGRSVPSPRWRAGAPGCSLSTLVLQVSRLSRHHHPCCVAPPVSPWASGGLCWTWVGLLSTLCCVICLPAHPPLGDGAAQGAFARTSSAPCMMLRKRPASPPRTASPL